ncbi:hypothetical protein IWY39_000033 [Sphingobium sp. JAI105]|uniref:hypothetical protein n=1 Tax=Sphingobium sp. JAI105 TaxID=2787715 RepID=UPI0018CAF35A|nr:hypothetical protein [Sphingobium sp. JAI105]MBG6116229.1 hypothetical protein [Sphingobium sp. JAI105]
MTKDRRPLTPYRALSRIADLLGWDGCAEVIGKSEWSVRKFSDPDAGRSISLHDAIRLDIAFRNAGGSGAPLFECYASRLDLLFGTEDGHLACLLDVSGKAAKEAGEAVAAALNAAANTCDPSARLKAITEIEEGIAAFQTVRATLGRGGFDDQGA